MFETTLGYPFTMTVFFTPMLALFLAVFFATVTAWVATVMTLLATLFTALVPDFFTATKFTTTNPDWATLFLALARNLAPITTAMAVATATVAEQIS